MLHSQGPGAMNTSYLVGIGDMECLKSVISAAQLGVLWEVGRGKGKVVDKGRQSL